MKYKKEAKKLLKTTYAPIGIAGASIGMGIAGTAFDSQPLQDAGGTTAGFVGPAVNITMGGYVVNKLRGLGKEVKQNKKNAKVKVL